MAISPESNRPRINRQDFLKIAKIAVLGGVAAASGLVGDRNERIESIGSNSTITPIYGMHSVGYDTYLQFWRSSFDAYKNEPLSEEFIWPEKVRSELKRVKPNILAVDSLSYTSFSPEGTQVNSYFWTLMPDNPFNLKGNDELTIVAADMPFDLLYAFKSDHIDLEPNSLEAQTLNGIIEHYEETLGQNLEDDLNLVVHEKKLDEFYDKMLYEPIASGSLGITLLLYLAAKPSLFDKEVSRKEFTALAAIALLSFSNSFRIVFAPSVFHTESGSTDPLYAPLSAVPEMIDKYKRTLPYVEFRNALIATKLDEVEEMLSKDGRERKKAAVMGTFHMLGKPVWYYPSKRNEVIRNMFEGIFQTLKRQDHNSQDRRKMVSYVAEIYGGVSLFRVGQEPNELTEKNIHDNIEQTEKFTSQIIQSLAFVAAVEAGFIDQDL